MPPFQVRFHLSCGTALPRCGLPFCFLCTRKGGLSRSACRRRARVGRVRCRRGAERLSGRLRFHLPSSLSASWPAARITTPATRRIAHWRVKLTCQKYKLRKAPDSFSLPRFLIRAAYVRLYLSTCSPPPERKANLETCSVSASSSSPLGAAWRGREGRPREISFRAAAFPPALASS